MKKIVVFMLCFLVPGCSVFCDKPKVITKEKIVYVDVYKCPDELSQFPLPNKLTNYVENLSDNDVNNHGKVAQAIVADRMECIQTVQRCEESLKAIKQSCKLPENK